MASVILIQPPITYKERFSRGSASSASLIPPLGLAYIAAYLRFRGHECTILDGLAEPCSVEELANMVQGYDAVGITVVSAFAVRAIELLKAIQATKNNAPVIVGGPHVTAMPESLLEYGAHYAVIGEGEITMCELLEQLEAGSRDLTQIKGLCFKDQNGFVFTGNRPKIDPLDQLPIPARDLLPMHLYRGSPARSSHQPSHSMLTSRGCPGTCTFCSKKTFGTKVRYFSAERILEEFLLLQNKYGARDVAVMDDNFVSNSEMVLSVCELMRQSDFNISWSVEARIDGVDRLILSQLKRAGCTWICYGIESGSQRILDLINKRTSKEQIRETIAITKEAGILIRGYFMLGLPTETLDEMEETLRFAIELDLDIASFSLFIPFPGTVDYKRAQQTSQFFDPEYFLHKIVPEFNFLDAPIYVPDGMTAGQLLAFHKKAYTRYYFRPKILLKKLLSIRSLDQFYSLLQGGYTLVHNAVTNPPK